MTVSPYLAYEESGVGWIGSAPTHWNISALKKAAILVTDRAEQRTFPVALENVEGWSGRYIETESDFAGDGVEFRCNDVLFGKLRPYLAKVWLASRSGEAIGDFHVLRCCAQMLPAFLQYLLLTPGVISLIDGSTHGAKMPRAGWDFVASLLIPLPPPDEQRIIVDFLDRETGKIDALVAEQERLIALLKEKRQAVISQAVTKGLNPDAPMRDSGIEWLGQVPVHWKVSRIRDVARLESGHTPSKQFPEYWENGTIEWVSLNDSKHLASHDYISETIFKITQDGLDNSSARLLPRNSVVFTRDAIIGLAAITTREMAVSQHLIAWCPSRAVNSIFLLRVFNVMKIFLDGCTTGATIKTIGMMAINKLVMPLPPIDEQNSVIQWISLEAGKIDALSSDAERAITLLRERRAALISAAVTGKIDVRGHAATSQAA